MVRVNTLTTINLLGGIHMWINPTKVENFGLDLICVQMAADNTWKSLKCKVIFDYGDTPDFHVESVDTDTNKSCFVCVGKLKDWLYKQYEQGFIPFFFDSMDDAISFTLSYQQNVNSKSVKVNSDNTHKFTVSVDNKHNNPTFKVRNKFPN